MRSAACIMLVKYPLDIAPAIVDARLSNQKGNQTMTDNIATLYGFTKDLMAYSDNADLHILVQPNTDLDDRFKAWDCDEQEWIRVNGWLFTFEPATVDA
jgi:hypothetical protein